ncbi:hypothetical protein FEM48_Zijuj05G0060300 [Ziziphus jujuba var. spinosa]|uniref:Sieve element occlusion N-terminal domain-containing protein n=1 Tax=Ziziphus jujuba var. spinosa TaxID=714518 RepID=A0A978VD82_ZIZJJ|nr:hypothetical protein FEM48_Zijuj05G0060300 [Ziziphus jujuba var. spinosa]
MQVDKINNRTYQPDDDSLVGTSEHTDTYRSSDERIGSFGLGNTAEALSHVIHDISREMLASYSWEVKVVVILAAFAVNYGDVWLVAQICSTNPLARSIAILKQVPELIEHFKSLQPHFDAIDISITKLIVEFSELPLEYLSLDTPPISVAKVHIPAASYWTIRAIVACKMKSNEEFGNLIPIFEGKHLDNLKVIRALLAPKDETRVLVIGNDMEKRPVSIDELIGKHVLLIISDLNVPCEEIQVFVTVYGMRHDVQSEMVWIPVVTGWQEQNQYKFAELQAVMPWYTVTTPLVIEPTVIGYVKEYWKFDRKTILVALDPLGRYPPKMHTIWFGFGAIQPFLSVMRKSQQCGGQRDGDLSYLLMELNKKY